MPSVKNNFLKGRMNKDLDDRLVPQGEYRDAKNIRISKSDTEDAGVVQNIKGTILKADPALGAGYEVIGYFFNEAANQIFYFSTDNSNSRISMYDVNTSTNFKLVETLSTDLPNGNWLNFHKDNLITGINVIDDLLFFTDNRNQPRRINIKTAQNTPDFYKNEDLVSVAKYAPYKAPAFTMSSDSSITGDYIQERFVRFSYRYKYKDNEYSVLAPFTQIAFEMGDGSQNTTSGNKLTSDEITKAYKSTILEKMVNGANKVVLDIPLPSSNPTTDYEIIEVDVLIKDSNSAAVRILETLDITDSTGNEITYTYKSSLPTKTLPADQVTRVSDKVPVRALAQEVAGNRIIYGNITENITFNDYNEIAEDGKLPVINYTVSYEAKDADQDDGNASTNFDHLPHHSIKQRRTYQVGVVLADKYGRQSPVILSENSTIYVPAKDDAFDSNGSWVGDCLSITFEPYTSGTNNIIDPEHVYNAATNPYGWYSYRFVVKQLEQEYYNVYTPGAVKYEDTGYITLHGDNINKVPQSTTGSSTDTKLGISDTRLYPKLLNKSTYTYKGFELNAAGQIVLRKVKLTRKISGSAPLNYNPPTIYSYPGSFASGGNMGKYSSTVYTLRLKSNDTSTNRYAPSFPGSNGLLFTTYTSAPDDGFVFVNGVLQDPSTYSFSFVDTSAESLTWDTRLTFTSAVSGTIDVILQYNDIPITGSDQFEIYILNTDYLQTLKFFFAIEETDDIVYEGLESAPENPQAASFDITSIIQKQSDAGLLNVLGMGTLDLFKDIDIADYVSSEVGFYEKDSKHIIASLSDTTDFAGLENYTGTTRGGAAVDLAVFETEPRQSALDLFFESSTSDTVDGLIEDLNTENNVEFDCTAAGVSGFAVAVNGTITAPTTTLGTINSITYIGATGTPASYASVATDTVRTARVLITPPSSGYSNSGGTDITCLTTATQLANIPALEIDDTEAVSINHQGFTANADVKADGGDTITEKGFYFGTNNTTYNGSGNTKFTVSGASTGDFTRAFTSSDSGFSAGTTRYLWSFVTTDGPGNDQDGPVTVTIPSAPTAPTGVTTTNMGTVTSVSAVCNGSYTNDGGSAVTESGFYVGTDSSDPENNQKYPMSSPDTDGGAFTYTVTSLSGSSTFYVWAYVKNGVDTSIATNYKTFTLQSSVSLPSVITKAESSVTTTGFTANGEVTSDGGATVTERGFYIKKDGGSYIKYTSGSGTGNFSYAFTRPAADGDERDYYYYAYAKNSAGTFPSSTPASPEYVELNEPDPDPTPQYNFTVVANNSATNVSLTKNPTNLTRTGDADSAFTEMTITVSPNSGYSFSNAGNITVTVQSSDYTNYNLTATTVMDGSNIKIRINGNIGATGNVSTSITISGGAIAPAATSVNSVQYSDTSSGPWYTTTSGANPGISVPPTEIRYIKISANGRYSLNNSGGNASYVSINDTTNTTGAVKIHTFTYGNNTTGSSVKNVVKIEGTPGTSIFNITSTISDAT